MSQDPEHLLRVRHALPAVQKLVYMNTGTAGPLPVAAIKVLQESQLAELIHGRISREANLRKLKAKVETKKLVAELLKADADDIVLTQNTTEGINFITTALKWQPGDEVITTNVEHAGVLLPLAALHQWHGVWVKVARLDSNPLEAIREQISSRTKLIAISHVSYSTGEVLPVEDIVELAHRHGIPVLLDGAQGAGAVPVDVVQLGVDFYSLPGQKWLCGPEGTGALYVRRERLKDLSPSFLGYGSVEEFDQDGNFRLHRSVRRFEVGSVNIPAITGLGASIHWLQQEVGLDWAYDRIRSLGQLTRRELAAIPGVTVLTPDRAAGLVSFRLEGVRPELLVEILAGQGIIIRSISELACVRASLGFFNTEEEVEKLVRAVAAAKINSV